MNDVDKSEKWSSEILKLKPWHQKIAVNDGFRPGDWDAKKQAIFILQEAPWPISEKVLDAGANAGGVSIGLSQSGVKSIVAIESSDKYANQFKFLSENIDTSEIKFLNDTLFCAHNLGAFKVCLFLGLI